MCLIGPAAHFLALRSDLRHP